MKKLILTFILGFSLLLTGCNTAQPPASDTDTTPRPTNQTPPGSTSLDQTTSGQTSPTQTTPDTESNTGSTNSQPTIDARIISPDLSKPLTSPTTIKGEITGTFFFEGVFPIILKDANGREIARTTAHADIEAFNMNLIPFTAELKFGKVDTSTGTLILQNDNPSGLPENVQTRIFRVIFDTSAR